MQLSSFLDENINYLKNHLPLGESFDLISREVLLGDTRAFFLGVNGLCRTDVLQWIISDLQDPSFMESFRIENPSIYIQSKLGFAQVALCADLTQAISQLLCGPIALFLDGFQQAILIDVRSYPSRSIEEPDLERVTTGARDGFVETMLSNANLIRRRVRCEDLCFSLHSVGTQSRTDVAVGYLKGSVNTSLLQKLSDTLDSLSVSALTMGAKSLSELLLPQKWYHPLPSIRMTQRPDVACSYLLEGHILILVDNSPNALILPCSIFQFTQSPEDYYRTPIVGSYLRLLRAFCVPATLLTLPVLLLIAAFYPDFCEKIGLLTPEMLSKGGFRLWLSPASYSGLLFFHICATEFLLDLFKYSSSLSSGKFSASLAIVGGLLIGDTAIELNWISTEVLFYGALTLLASLAISDMEFGDALRLYRILLLITTAMGGTPGFCLGLVLILLSAASTPTYGGFSYFWPLFPFNKKALGRLLFRSPTPKAQPDKIWNRGNAK